jgi:hypothetical protein
VKYLSYHVVRIGASCDRAKGGNDLLERPMSDLTSVPAQLSVGMPTCVFRDWPREKAWHSDCAGSDCTNGGEVETPDFAGVMAEVAGNGSPASVCRDNLMSIEALLPNFPSSYSSTGVIVPPGTEKAEFRRQAWLH